MNSLQHDPDHFDGRPRREPIWPEAVERDPSSPLTLTECIMSWERIGLDRGLNPLLELLTPKLQAALTECRVTDGCERGHDHYGVCIVPHGDGGPWSVHFGGWSRKTNDPEGFFGEGVLKGITG